MKKNYVIGLDFGTSGIRSILFDVEGNPVSSGFLETPTTYPKPGYAQIDPDLVVHCAREATRIAISDSCVDPRHIIGVSFSNICSSIVPINHQGEFLYPFIPWNDTRCYEMFDYMRDCMAKDGTTDEEDYKTTGYTLRCNCTLPSMLWLKKNYPDIYNRTYKFLSAHAVLAMAFTGKYVDDQSGITFSKVADVKTLTYLPELCDRYDFDFNKLPEVQSCCSYIGGVTAECAAQTGLWEGTPVYVGAGDVMSGTIGMGACDDGVACMILGTGGCINVRCPELILHPEAKIPLHGSPVGGWHIFGATSAAASSYSWFAKLFCQLEDACAKLQGHSVFELMNDLASQSPAGANGVLYLPWLMGNDCPHLDSNARAAFIGMSFSHTKNDLIRAVLEGVSFDLRVVREVEEEMLPEPMRLIRLMGGGAKSRLWSQMQADVHNLPVETTYSEEPAALAAALYAVVGAGIDSSLSEAAARMVKVKDRYEPNPEAVEQYQKIYKIYKGAYSALAPKLFPELASYQSFCSNG